MIAMGEDKSCRLVEDLLPGILDCIVLDKIVPKLEWKDFYTLPSVSYAWYNAIRSRRVFDSRVRSNSLETFFACYTHQTIALYSMRENSWHELPRIADVCGGQDKMPASAQCISMDGKVYVLGGMINSEITNKVFVFDLAGQGRWEQCASMKQARRDFGSAVIDGKIYVFGGCTPSTRFGVCNSEVYEPKEDTWSPIRPMAKCRYGQHVTRVGEELFNHSRFSSGCIHRRVEAYHPFKDEWRLVHSWNQLQHGLLFAVHGNVFSMEADYTGHGISLEVDHTGRFLNSKWSLAIRKYDIQGNSWIHVCSFSLFSLIPVEYELYGSIPCVTPDAVLAVDDELIALVSCYEREDRRRHVLCLLQSTGFGGETQKISWKLRATTFGPVLDGAGYYFAQKL